MPAVTREAHGVGIDLLDLYFVDDAPHVIASLITAKRFEGSSYQMIADIFNRDDRAADRSAVGVFVFDQQDESAGARL